MTDCTVTDHCLLRFFERVLKYDIEKLRQQIAADCGPALRAGFAAKIVGDHRYEFKNGAVVTVTLKSGGTPCRTRKNKLLRGKA